MLILVDEKDNQIGVGEKIQVHKEGRLHRAFSVLIFNSQGELLLQKRAKTKYHSPSLWSNTCCSHPRPNHELREEAKNRLEEEMGIKSNLKEVFSFIYKQKTGGLIEHEFDHVFFGKFDGSPVINKKEVEDWKWMNFKDLRHDVQKNPQKYTPWFRLILNEISKRKLLKRLN